MVDGVGRHGFDFMMGVSLKKTKQNLVLKIISCLLINILDVFEHISNVMCIYFKVTCECELLHTF